MRLKKRGEVYLSEQLRVGELSLKGRRKEKFKRQERTGVWEKNCSMLTQGGKVREKLAKRFLKKKEGV